MNKCKSHSVSAFRSLCVSVRRRAIRTKEKNVVKDYVMTNRKEITCNYSGKISFISFSMGCQMYKSNGQ